MPDISLREYLAKLESALYAGSADEVIHHCRHILQFYPKNVAAYRYLGRALVYNARYDEGSAALQRVLSVAPDDYAAHLALSESFDGLKRGDDAIWHLERAFEQQPNNGNLIEGVRALYRRYRQIDPKIQLTNAAIARQHILNGRTDQAVEALRIALDRMPDRVDLKMLLASTLWKRGDDVEGAETALDVLEVLPDCLEANAILTELWLDEERPSDAQRYLNRVESVDPYRALEIAQGDAPDDAFRLDELDYQRFAKTELSSSRPDWLTQVTGGETTSTNTMPSVAPANDDWSRWTSGLLSSSESAPSEKAVSMDTSPFPIIDDDPDFNPFADLPENTNQLPDSILRTPSNDDPMAWMRDAGVEIFDEEPSLPQFDDEFRIDIDAQSPTAWMNDDIIMADPPALSSLVQEDDEMAWLRDQMPAEALLPDSTPAYMQETPSYVQQPPPATDFSWAQNDAALEEAFGMEQLTGITPTKEPSLLDQFPDLDFLTGTPETTGGSMTPADEPEFNLDFDFVPSDDEPVAATPTDSLPDWMNASAYEAASENPPPVADSLPSWMAFDTTSATAENLTPQTSDDVLPDWIQPDSIIAPQADADTNPLPQSLPGARKGLTGLLNNANLDWLTQVPPEPEPEPAQDDWMGLFNDPVPATSGSADDAPDWLNALDEDAEPSTVPLPDAPQAAQPAEMEFDMPSDQNFDWLPSDSSEDDDQQETPIAMPSAADEPEPVNISSAADDFDWLSVSENDPVEDEEVAPETIDLSWLIQDDDAPSAEAPAEEIAVSATPTPVELPTELPDWLLNLQPEQSEAETPEVIASNEMIAEGDLSFLDDMPITADMPTLAETPEVIASNEMIAEGDLSFMDDMPITADMPTLYDIDIESEADPFAVSTATTENDLATPLEFSWTMEFDADDPSDEQDAFAAEPMMQEPESLLETTMPTAPDLSFFDEMDAIEDQPTEPTPENQFFEIPTPEFTPLNFDDDSLENIEQVDEDYEPIDVQPVMGITDSTDEALHPELVENVPDWLNAMVPGIDIDYDATDEEPSLESEFVEEPEMIAPTDASATPAIGNTDFQWLTNIVDEESREIIPEAPMDFPENPIEPAKPRFGFTRRPEWLKFSSAPAWMKGKSAPAPTAPTAAEQSDDFPDWPEEDADGSSELPEWLK